ncbi:MAG: 2'-5' RNA ligase family protein [Chloroflexota bacterium]
MSREPEPGQRDWLPEVDARGFAEATPTNPNFSITITPRGQCYRLAKGIITRLARVACAGELTQPHITLQGIYGDADLALVHNRVAKVATTTPPFRVTITGLGLLASPGDPERLHLHLHVERSSRIVALYAKLKQELDSLGLRTYPYSPEEWVPHLTLASGRWSRQELIELLREVGPTLPVCILPIDEFHLNRLDPDYGWERLERFPLALPRAS